MNSYAEFGGAARRLFSAICEKPMGGGTYVPPPAVRGLKACQHICIMTMCQKYILSAGAFVTNELNSEQYRSY